MDYVSDYGRLVSSFAVRLTDNPESRRDFCQDAYLRIHQLSQKYPEDSATHSEFWRKQVHVAVRNLMLDNARKNSVRRRYYAALETVDSESEKPVNRLDRCSDPTQNQFEQLAVQHAVEELFRLLPPNGQRILEEIINPTPGFVRFVKRRHVVQRIWNSSILADTERAREKIVDRLRHASADPAIGEYLQITPKEFREHIKNINFYVSSLL